MKKFLTSALLPVVIFSLSAQQLPDNGFEEEWVNCYPWTSNTNNTKQTVKQGTTPPDWNVSNSIGAPMTSGRYEAITVAERVEGNGGGYAVKVSNKYTVLSVISGYVTLGTPWSTSINKTKKDGGTWGGIGFAYRPDALQFDYKSTGTSAKLPSVVAYAWKGEYSQASVPADIVMNTNPKKVAMKNRDRNILGIQTAQGGNVTQSGTRICQINDNTTLSRGQSTFTTVAIPFIYESTETPEMINVIFAAGDYFSTSQETTATLTIDNVVLLYYSRLQSLSVNGTDVPGFSTDTYEYAMTVDALPTADQIEATCLGTSGSGSAQVTVDGATKTATIVVTNSNVGGTDVDGQTSHTYIINFTVDKEGRGDTVYEGQVDIGEIDMDDGGDPVDPEPVDGSVHIIDTGNGTCTFVLPNFSLDGTELGDIVVENVNMTPGAGRTTYSGTVKGLKLLDGNIVANVEISGFTDDEGNCEMVIEVKWLSDPENDPDGNTSFVPIHVTFNGRRGVTGIDGVESTPSVYPVEYYNIQGMRVNPENLTPGIYIRRQGKDVKKILRK